MEGEGGGAEGTRLRLEERGASGWSGRKWGGRKG